MKLSINNILRAYKNILNSNLETNKDKYNEYVNIIHENSRVLKKTEIIV